MLLDDLLLFFQGVNLLLSSVLLALRIIKVLQNFDMLSYGLSNDSLYIIDNWGLIKVTWEAIPNFQNL